MAITLPILSGDILQSACQNVQKKHAFTIEAHAEKLSVREMSVLSRIRHWKDSSFHAHRLRHIGELFTNTLRSHSRLSIAEVEHHPTVLAARALLKQLKCYSSNAHVAESLNQEILASRLGISSDVFRHNPGFFAFASKHHLDRYLLAYGDEIKVDPETLKLSIRYRDVYTPWEEVHEEIQGWPKRNTAPQQPWIYGMTGIQNGDMYDWTELKPYMKCDPAAWNNQYIFEFCACQNPDTIKTGNHSWINLKTDTGEVFSVGLYRPGKLAASDNLKSPLRIKPGILMQPEVSEFWPWPIYRIPVAISKQEFLAIKESIEKDKKEDNLLFQLFNNNCTLYCKAKASLANIDIPTSERCIELVSPPALKYRVAKVMASLPSPMRKACDLFQACIVNLFELALGAARIDSSLNPKQRQKALPHIQSIGDIFNPEKATLNHPITLAFKTKPTIDKWREKKIQKLQDKNIDPQRLKFETAQITYRLPKQLYHHHFPFDEGRLYQK